MEFQDPAEPIQQRVSHLLSGLKHFLNTNDINEASRLRINGFIDKLKSIQEALKSEYIGVVGGISAGKSTYLNHILGGSVLAKSGGETTGVPTELRCKTGQFVATIIFFTVQDIERKLKYFARFFEDDKPISTRWSDYEAESMKPQITAIFEFNGNDMTTKPVNPADPDGIQPIDFIGRAPINFRSDTREGLADQIKEYLAVPRRGRYTRQHFVKKVIIEGPFERLPPGMVLVDTPGLGSAAKVNSQRTIDTTPSLDRVWFITSDAQRLGNEVEHNYLKGCNLPIELLISNCEDFSEEEDRIQEVTEQYEKATGRYIDLSLIFQTNVPSHGIATGFDSRYAKFEEFRVYRQEEVRRNREILETIENELQRVDSIGPFTNQPDQLNTWLNQFNTIFTSILQDTLNLSGNNLQNTLYNNLFIGDFALLENIYHTTWLALFIRDGVFYSNTSVHRSGSIDLNSDILYEFKRILNENIQNIRDIVTESMEKLEAVVVAWANLENSPPSLRTEFSIIQQDFVKLRREFQDSVFGMNIQTELVHYFKSIGVYDPCTRRRKAFTPVELGEALDNVLLPNYRAHVTQFSNFISNAAARLRNTAAEAGTFPPEVRGQLDLSPVVLEGMEDSVITCPITAEIMVDPVQVCSRWQHVFERDALNDYFRVSDTYRCPLCREDIPEPVQYVHRHDIRRLIEIRRDANIPAEDLPQDWYQATWHAARIIADQVVDVEAVTNSTADAEQQQGNIPPAPAPAPAVHVTAELPQLPMSAI